MMETEYTKFGADGGHLGKDTPEKRSCMLECRECGTSGYYEDIRDDYGAEDKEGLDFKYGKCGECDPVQEEDDEDDG